MSNDHVSALEQAFSNSQARELHTQKQIDVIFQQLQQLITQQQRSITPPTTSPKTENPISDSVSSTLIRRAPPPALPNEFDGDRSKGPTFLRSRQTYICLCPDSFSDDQTKIIWSLSYMKTGRAAKWAARIFKYEEDNAGCTKFLDWEDFKSEFQKKSSAPLTPTPQLSINWSL